MKVRIISGFSKEFFVTNWLFYVPKIVWPNQKCVSRHQNTHHWSNGHYERELSTFLWLTQSSSSVTFDSASRWHASLCSATTCVCKEFQSEKFVIWNSEITHVRKCADHRAKWHIINHEKKFQNHFSLVLSLSLDVRKSACNKWIARRGRIIIQMQVENE